MALIELRGENIGTGEFGKNEGDTRLESCDDTGISEVEKRDMGDLEVFKCCGVWVNGLIRGHILVLVGVLAVLLLVESG